ncbi:MAG: hypothetical protein QGI21_03340 [Candidatus Poseidoniaceae archaeon]|nr:hypothetical protein [Candidatus Poseidoniaceae archaeon]
MAQGIRPVLLIVIFLLSIPIIDGEADEIYTPSLTSTLEDGSWVNGTLIANGSTQDSPLNVEWLLINLSHNVEDLGAEILSGTFFTTVDPVSDNLWIWSLSANVSDIECACLLRIIQENTLLEIMIFIGEGPHNPVLLPEHESEFVIDESIIISTSGYVADGNLIDSKLIVSTCHAPNGACDSAISNFELNISWDGNLGSLQLNATSMEMYDGRWMLSYHLRDAMLRSSQNETIWLNVDQSNPISHFSTSSSGLEGDEFHIDGSGSNDGVWGSELQCIWYVEAPSGEVSIIYGGQVVEVNGGLYYSQEWNPLVVQIYPSKVGTYNVTLEVIDQVGRRSSTSSEINVINVHPEVSVFHEDGIFFPEMIIDDDNLQIQIYLIDGDGMDDNIVSYWYLDGNLVGSNSECKSWCELELLNLKSGIHKLEIVSMDEDGAYSNITHEFEVISTKEKSSSSTGMLVVGAVIFLMISMLIYVLKPNNSPKFSNVPKWQERSRKEESNLEEMWQEK